MPIRGREENEAPKHSVYCLSGPAGSGSVGPHQASSSDKGAVDASETVTPDLRIAPA